MPLAGGQRVDTVDFRSLESGLPVIRSMRRTFRPLQPLRGWRKVAAQTWQPPRDPSVYATLDIPMRSALAYLERLREESGVRATVTHVVARGVALAIRQYPQLNGIVARRRIMLRDTVDIF